MKSVLSREGSITSIFLMHLTQLKLSHGPTKPFYIFHPIKNSRVDLFQPFLPNRLAVLAVFSVQTIPGLLFVAVVY